MRFDIERDENVRGMQHLRELRTMKPEAETRGPQPGSSVRNALVFLVIAVAGIGFFLFRARQDARMRQLGLTDPEAKKHLVTEPMSRNAKAFATKPAPVLELTDSEGKSIRLNDLAKDKLVVVYFVKDGCPCSETYEPFIQEVARNYSDVATFLAVIDGTRETAAAWSSRYVLPYPIAFDTTSATMASWGATNSAFTALVDRSGKVVDYWPGYSLTMLEDLGRGIAELAGVPRRRLALLDAPSRLYTGCSFSAEDPSEIVRP